jgi:hypothetical protein
LNRHATGRLDVEIRRHRAAMKSWVLKRIADTPVFSDQEKEASSWFHGLPVAERSRLVTDLARVNVKGANLFAIATGPLGALFTRYPQLFEERETGVDPIEGSEDSLEDLAVPIGAMSELDSSDSAWFDDWENFELDIEGPIWPND